MGQNSSAGIYIIDKINWKMLYLKMGDIKRIFVETLQKKDKSFIVGSIYRLPQGSQNLHIRISIYRSPLS